MLCARIFAILICMHNNSSADIHWASENEIPQVFSIRHKVFVLEQHVDPLLEQDGLDDQAFHAILLVEHSPMGCVRIRPIESQNEAAGQNASDLHQHQHIFHQKPQLNRLNKDHTAWKLERLAVSAEARGRGYGKKIMKWAIQEAETFGICRLELHAQYHLLEFYKHLGFLPRGDVFTEAGIQHIQMEMELRE
ncbi:MAG: GNAT family N-acetyltransferase [Spirochaetia bacterium]|nr:GNAT family N-acetyltransferase [Spirochaetia bacterium]